MGKSKLNDQNDGEDVVACSIAVCAIESGGGQTRHSFVIFGPFLFGFWPENVGFGWTIEFLRRVCTTLYERKIHMQFC